jgi:hypothetical protein
VTSPSLLDHRRFDLVYTVARPHVGFCTLPKLTKCIEVDRSTAWCLLQVDRCGRWQERGSRRAAELLNGAKTERYFRSQEKFVNVRLVDVCNVYRTRRRVECLTVDMSSIEWNLFNFFIPVSPRTHAGSHDRILAHSMHVCHAQEATI